MGQSRDQRIVSNIRDGMGEVLLITNDPVVTFLDPQRLAILPLNGTRNGSLDRAEQLLQIFAFERPNDQMTMILSLIHI